MGLELENGGFNGGWVGIGPRLGILLVFGEVGVEFLKARFRCEIKIAEGDERLNADRIGRIALNDAVGIGSDFRDLDGRASVGGSATGEWPTRVVVRKQGRLSRAGGWWSYRHHRGRQWWLQHR